HARDVTGAADLYALGALLYRAVSGEHLFGESIGVELAHAKLTTTPPPLETGRLDPIARGPESVVARAVEPGPSERYEGADEMLAALSLLRDAARKARRLAEMPVPSRSRHPSAPPSRSTVRSTASQSGSTAPPVSSPALTSAPPQ